MKNSTTYENLHFDSMINLIRPDDYPRSFAPHWHKYAEIASAAAGSGARQSLRVNQTVYDLQPGDVLFIWPGEIHEILENTGGQTTGLQFSTALFHELPDFTPFFHLFRTVHLISGAKDAELAQRVQAHLDHMLYIQENKGIFPGVETLICLYELFMDLGMYIKNTRFRDAKPDAFGRGRTIEKISMACSYLMDNCDRELTLESTADYAGFSTYYFSRVFRQITGYHFVEYLTIQRIKRAQMLLSDSSLSITEISYLAGFKSISTFNRVFRQHCGCSPSRYRNYYLHEHT